MKNPWEETNMKIWKKLSLVLCLCFAFSGVATSCLGGDDSSSSSNSQNSSSSGNQNSSDDNQNSSDDGDNTSAIIDVYIGMITRTLEKSNSAKLTFELETTTTASATDGAGTVGGWTNYLFKGEGIVSKTEDGFNAKLDVQVPAKDTPGQTEAKIYYYIDGYVYEYVTKTNVYKKYNETPEELLDNLVHSMTEGTYTLETLLASVAGGGLGGIVGGDFSDMSYDSLEEAFSEYGEMESKITDTGMQITADASKKADELFDFIRTIDKDTTYGDLLDYPLSQINPEWDTKTVIANLYPRGNDTVNKLVDDLNKKSVEETEKTLQQNLDTILKSELVTTLLDSFELDKELVSDIKNFKIGEFLKKDSSIQDKNGAYIKNGDLTLNNLSKELVSKLIEALGDENDDILGELGLLSGNVNWGMLVSAMEMVLDWKAFENIPEDSQFYDLLDKAQTLEVSKADMAFELKVNTKDIESFTINGNFGGNATDDGVSAKVGATADIVISEFSTNKLTIAIPENATIEIVYSECTECGETKETVSYREDHFGYYCDECFAALPEAPAPEVTE